MAKRRKPEPDDQSGSGQEDAVKFWVFTPYIVRNGIRIYPKRAKVFRFPAKH